MWNLEMMRKIWKLFKWPFEGNVHQDTLVRREVIVSPIEQKVHQHTNDELMQDFTQEKIIMKFCFDKIFLECVASNVRINDTLKKANLTFWRSQWHTYVRTCAIDFIKTSLAAIDIKFSIHLSLYFSAEDL
jgi:hypothetical protein